MDTHEIGDVELRVNIMQAHCREALEQLKKLDAELMKLRQELNKKKKP